MTPRIRWVSPVVAHKLTIAADVRRVERGNSRTADAARDVTIRESFAYSLARKPGWKSREIIRAPWTSRIRLPATPSEHSLAHSPCVDSRILGQTECPGHRPHRRADNQLVAGLGHLAGPGSTDIDRGPPQQPQQLDQLVAACGGDLVHAAFYRLLFTVRRD